MSKSAISSLMESPVKSKLKQFYLFKLPFCIVLTFSFVTLFNFLYTFVFSAYSYNNLIYSTSAFYNARAFFFTFGAFYLLFIFSAALMILSSSFYSKLIGYILGLTSCCLMVYSADKIFTIKIFIYIAFIIAAVFGIKRIFSFLCGLFSISTFLFVECIPYFNKTSENWFYKYSVDELTAILFYMTVAMFFSLIAKRVLMEYLMSIDTVHHQNIVMNQMSLLNNKLQEYAKTHGEEAVMNERMRITRDMHDSCGYAFVNITAIIDAIMSNPEISGEQLSDTLLTVRNLASKGLKETRNTLHTIREMENPGSNTIDGIYEIQKIFEQVTGINVEIQSGNIKNSYGSTINSIIMHTMQEGLTNAIRHGRARNIFVSFWDDVNLLTMVIKDDGIGSKEVVKGIGLAGMEERLGKVHGVLEVSTPMEGGFRLEIKLPLVNIDADELKM